MNPTGNDVHELAKMIKWHGNTELKILNFEGIEKIVDIEDNFKELRSGSVPYFNLAMQNKFKHFYYERSSFTYGDILNRLIRKYQAYRTTVVVENKTKIDEIYDELFNVDYFIDNGKDKFVAETSFTYLHWKLVDLINQDAKFDLSTIHKSQIKRLMLNIFPKCKNALHEFVD